VQNFAQALGQLANRLIAFLNDMINSVVRGDKRRRSPCPPHHRPGSKKVLNGLSDDANSNSRVSSRWVSGLWFDDHHRFQTLNSMTGVYEYPFSDPAFHVPAILL
jgi:hypothetical protein